jgi:hypothetical protein
MKRPMDPTHTFTMLTSRLAAIFLFVVLLSAAPFHAALSQSAPDLPYLPDLGYASSFAVLGGTAVTLTNAPVIGDVGSPTAVTVTGGEVTGTVYPAGDEMALLAYRYAFVTSGTDLSTYDALARVQCAHTISGLAFSGDLASPNAWMIDGKAYPGGPLGPGVYCFEAAATFTDAKLTLDGPSDGIWIFKIGTLGTGALTGTNFSVVMANGGSPCNVYWWVAGAATLTDSNFVGTILAGEAITTTRGTLNGQALAKAAVTITGTAVAVCGNSPLPPIPPPDKGDCKKCKECSDYWNNYWNNYWINYYKDCGKICDNCKGKVTELTLQYRSAKDAWVLIRVETKGKDGGVIFNTYVEPNRDFIIKRQDKKGDDGTLGTEITLYVDNVQNTTIHTSCSQPIYPGLVRGDFIVIRGWSKDGGLLAKTDCWEHKDKDKK